MKKIIICITIVFFTNTIKAQTVITDTTQYLIDSIEAKKNEFAGKSLNYLIGKLKLGVRHYMTEVPLLRYPSILKIQGIDLYFLDFKDMIPQRLQNKKIPSIEVIFTQPFLVPKTYLERGGILDWGTGWNNAKANFLGNCIVHQVNVVGL
jgi:hypothetical protein